MRGIGGTLGKINKSFGIGSTIKAGGKTLFGIIKKLIWGGAIIGGILLLDKFFNSKYWPMMIKFIGEELIPNIKTFATYLMTDFGPDIKKLLVGEDGEWKKPTGGIFGTILNIFNWFKKPFVDVNDLMKEDKTGSKFKKSMKDFITLMKSIFNFSGDYGDVADANARDGFRKLTYWERVMIDAGIFKTSLLTLFKSLGKTIGEGIFGYTTEEEDFFVGVRKSLVIMFEKIVRGIGEAFVEAHPKVGALLGFKTVTQNKLLDMEKEKPELIKPFFDSTKNKYRKELRAEFDALEEEDKAFMKEYLILLNQFESRKVVTGIGKLNVANNALIASVLGTESMMIAQIESAELQKLIVGANKSIKWLGSKLKPQDASEISKLGSTNLKGQDLISGKNIDQTLADLKIIRDEDVIVSSTGALSFKKVPMANELKYSVGQNLNQEAILKKLLEAVLGQTSPTIVAAPSTQNNMYNTTNQTNNALAANPNGILTGYSYTGMNPH